MWGKGLCVWWAVRGVCDGVWWCGGAIGWGTVGTPPHPSPSGNNSRRRNWPPAAAAASEGCVPCGGEVCVWGDPYSPLHPPSHPHPAHRRSVSLPPHWAWVACCCQLQLQLHAPCPHLAVAPLCSASSLPPAWCEQDAGEAKQVPCWLQEQQLRN